MNANNAKDYLPFVIALAEGKKLQILNDWENWEDSEEMQFNLPPGMYRIKPEPVVISFDRWVVLRFGCTPSTVSFITKKEAEDFADDYGIPRTNIKHIHHEWEVEKS